MPAIPLPFITFTLLLTLLINLCWQQRSVNRASALLISLCAVMTLCVGLRWCFNVPLIHLIQPVLATILPLVIGYFFYRGTPQRFWRRITAVVAVSVMMAWPISGIFDVDTFIAFLNAGVGINVLLLAKRSDGHVSKTHVGDISLIQNSALLTGASLCFSGFIDLLIALDFTYWQGQHAIRIVAIAQMFVLPLIALGVLNSFKHHPQQMRLEATSPSPSFSPHQAEVQEDRVVYQHISLMIKEKELWRDVDLTLDRLARKARIPTRKISRAVNRIQQCNVSQMINGYRVAEAQRLLTSTNLPIIEIMADAGFRTKSNFNREFQRQCGCNPGEFRQKQAASQSVPSSTEIH